jgi:membrane-bound lytic murein transglycosylase A
LSQLPGWAVENHQEAFAALRRSCRLRPDPALARVCATTDGIVFSSDAEARGWLEAAFQAERIPGDGVLTAYFAPIYDARRQPDAEFSAPVRPKPADLVVADGGIVLQVLPDGSAAPYPDRAAIEAAPIDKPLAWMRPEELFFLQVQGSGVLTFEDGQRLKAVYAAHNGRPFAGIANPMRDRGLLARDNTSGDAIRGWLAAHRGPEADEIMRLNPRYAFFRLAPDDGKPPVGAANVPLPAGRAVAVDPAYHTYGELLWIDAEAPLLAGAFPAYRRLVSALDTGGAIKGQVRADLYLGQGAAAGIEAGRVRHTLRLYRLVPRP